MAALSLKEKIKRILQLDLNKKNYISEIDLFLAKFDQSHPELSEFQKKEKAKFEKIANLRDHAQKDADKSKLGKDF